MKPSHTFVVYVWTIRQSQQQNIDGGVNVMCFSAYYLPWSKLPYISSNCYQ